MTTIGNGKIAVGIHGYVNGHHSKGGHMPAREARLDACYQTYSRLA
jgi:hypothetical protein